MKARLSVGHARKKFGIGGDATYGSKVTTSDVSDGEVNKWGSVGISTLSGAAAGAAAGSVVPGIGTAIGAVGGAIVGFVGGLFGSRKRKKALAAQKEAQRQATIQAMDNKLENDYYNMKNQTFNDFSEGEGYYAKYGGSFGRRQLNDGGTIEPNSSNTSVVYGNTHEQMNPYTGQTGVSFGDVEVEGGGTRNGTQYSGEVIKNTNGSSRVYSDTLTIPGSNITFADASKQLSDKKGLLESENEISAEIISKSLDVLGEKRFNRNKLGTNTRNIEKAVFDVNKRTGEIYELDNIENKLYDTQEVKAEYLGLRGNPYSAKYGGSYKMFAGGDVQGYASLGSFALNGLNAWANKEAIDFEEKLTIPEMSMIEAPQYNNNYSITAQLSELDSDKSTAEKFITSNTSNSQIARNAMSMIAIKANKAKGQLYHTKNTVEQQLSDRNIEARHQTNLNNNQIRYQNSLNKYNKAVDINSKRTANSQQFIQSIQGVIDSGMANKMEKYKIGSQNILQASDKDTERLDNLYKDIWGVDFSSIKNLFKKSN